MTTRFRLVLYGHQPPGNFDGIDEALIAGSALTACIAPRRSHPLPLEGKGGGGGENAALAKSVEAALTREAEAPGGTVRLETIAYAGGDSSTLTAAYRLTGIRRGRAARRASEVHVRFAGPSDGIFAHMDATQPVEIDVRP